MPYFRVRGVSLSQTFLLVQRVTSLRAEQGTEENLAGPVKGHLPFWEEAVPRQWRQWAAAIARCRLPEPAGGAVGHGVRLNLLTFRWQLARGGGLWELS